MFFFSYSTNTKLGKNWCKDSMHSAATKVQNNFIKPLLEKFPNLKIGDIEPYPALRANEIITWLTTLKSVGTKLSHFHIDIDFNHIRKSRIKHPDREISQIRQFCSKNGIKFGIIVNPAGFGPKTTTSYYQATMNVVNKYLKSGRGMFIFIFF